MGNTFALALSFDLLSFDRDGSGLDGVDFHSAPWVACS